MTRNERKRRRRKTEHLVRFTAFLLLAAIIWAGGYTYAKYFSEKSRYGVAIASGVYFTANYAASSSANGEEFFESVVNSNYGGDNYSFTFDVRNYENNILFNESGMTIPYSLSFWLGETPEGAVYSVKWQEGEETREEKFTGMGTTNKITIENQSIHGGSASVVPYTISITGSSGNHAAVPIYVEVQTDAGAIINKTLRGKMVLNNSAPPEHYIEEQNFVVPEEYGDDVEAQFAQIQKQAMLTYEIRTVGEVAADVKEQLKLSWDPNILEIDLFDEAYFAWQKSNTKDGVVPQKPAEDSSGWYYITLEAMPYSSQTVSFFRGKDYASTITNMEALKNAITAVIISEEIE